VGEVTSPDDEDKEMDEDEEEADEDEEDGLRPTSPVHPRQGHHDWRQRSREIWIEDPGTRNANVIKSRFIIPFSIPTSCPTTLVQHLQRLDDNTCCIIKFSSWSTYAMYQDNPLGIGTVLNDRATESSKRMGDVAWRVRGFTVIM